MNTSNKKRAVIYCRVSTKEQVEEGNSLATQEKICKEYALKNDYEIVEIFREQGESAKNANRTELQRLIGFCTSKKNGINFVVAYKIDRVARNIDDYRFIRAKLREYDIEIKSTSEYFEDTPAGRFMENIIANVAQFDNDVRTERSVNGMRDATREGRYVWKAPLGYTNTKVAGKANIISNDMAFLVQKLFAEVARNNTTIENIRMNLAKKGMLNKKGNPLSRSHLYSLLNNELYCGWITKFGERHKGTFEPLISEELFEQAQRVLRRGGRRSLIYQRENPDFPLRRFVFHPTGEKLTGHWSQGRRKKYAYYRFIANKTEYTKDFLEIAYKKFINEYTLDTSHIMNLKESLETTLLSATKTEVDKGEDTKLEIAALNQKATFLLEKNEKGIISDSLLRKQLEEIEEKLMVAHANLVEVPPINVSNLDELVEITKEYLEQPGEVWQKISFKQKVLLQWFEFPQGITFQNGQFRTTEIARIYKAKDSFLPVLSSMVDSGIPNYKQTTNTNQPQKRIPLKDCEEILRDISRLAEILKEEPP